MKERVAFEGYVERNFTDRLWKTERLTFPGYYSLKKEPSEGYLRVRVTMEYETGKIILEGYVESGCMDYLERAVEDWNQGEGFVMQGTGGMPPLKSMRGLMLPGPCPLRSGPFVNSTKISITVECMEG